MAVKDMAVKDSEVEKTIPTAEVTSLKPKAMVEVEGGVKWTTSRDIKLIISARDDRGVGIAGYFVSEDKTPPTASSGSWIVIPQSYPLCTSYSGAMEWTLGPRDGMKDIYVWCKDGEGNISEPSAVNILLTSYEFIKKWGQMGSGELEFIAPSAIAYSPNGGFYIVDTDNHRVQRFDKDFNFVKQWGGKGKVEGKFYYPRGIAVDPSGIIYVVDSGNNRIQKFDAEGNFIAQWGNVLTNVEKKKPGEWSYIDGNETDFSTTGNSEVDFYDPLNVAIDSKGDILVVDSGNHRIKRYDKDGKLLSAWGVNGSLDGMLHYPCGIAVDDSQAVYVSDMGNNRIQKFDRDGKFMGKWGKKGNAEGELKLPLGIVIDSSGYIYVADSGNHRIEKFDKDGNFINGFGLTGSGDGEFNAPVFIAIDHEGYIYVLERTNARVQKFRYVPRA